MLLNTTLLFPLSMGIQCIGPKPMIHCSAERFQLLSLASTKKGSNVGEKIWTDIAQSLKNCQQLKFKQNLQISQRAVRERFSLLQTRYKEKEREETQASGISPEQDELDALLEEITEREKAAEENREDVNRKKENDKVTAEEMRKTAMEMMSQTKKRKDQEDN